ncbi:MAG: hypothetical protein V1776_01630 [Candidatus Diapherotrites archaeon]
MGSLQKKGQATIELLLIMVVLLTILGISISIASTHQQSIQQKRITLEAEKTAAQMKEAIYQVWHSPEGMQLQVFIPPATQTQSIRVENGLLEVRSSSVVVQIPLFLDLNTSTVYDGNMILVTRTYAGVTIE